MAEVAEKLIWYKTVKAEDYPKNGGSCVKYKDLQIAVFYFATKDEWYACQNLCPHKMQMVLSRGMIGSKGDIPKVACPYHKKTFSLTSGENLDGEDYSIETYPIKLEADGYIYIQVPE